MNESRNASRGDDVESAKLLGGMRCEPLVEDGERVDSSVSIIKPAKKPSWRTKTLILVPVYWVMVLILKRWIESLYQPSEAMDDYEVIVIDEIGKFSVESEAFVEIVRKAMEVDKPTLVTLHKKSRHPLLQDIRRRDDARILEVTPVNRALLPYKIHKLMRETY